MQNITRIVIMSIMLMLAACGGGQTPTTKVYTSANDGQTITIPASVSNLTLLSGQGGSGSPASGYWVDYYSKKTIIYNQRNDQGGVVNTLDGGTTYHFGEKPANYCDPQGPYVQNGVVNYSQTCYEFTDLDFYNETPATTGAAATMAGPNGFSRSWAGGAGGPAAATSAENVAVTPGGQYVLTIPPGGSITLSYYE